LADPVERKAVRGRNLVGDVPVEISIWIWSEPGWMTGLEMVEPRRPWEIGSRLPSRDCAVDWMNDHCIAW
jgi:hypothetical protein